MERGDEAFYRRDLWMTSDSILYSLIGIATRVAELSSVEHMDISFHARSVDHMVSTFRMCMTDSLIDHVFLSPLRVGPSFCSWQLFFS